MRLTVYEAAIVSPTRFVNFWSEHYHDPRQCTYDQVIGQPIDEDRARELIGWRSKTGYTKEQREVIEKEFIAKVHLFKHIPRSTSPRRFLEKFPRGGAMLRLFWLHCWQPSKYPLFDSHTHRAMCHVLEVEHQELSALGEIGQIHAYLQQYLPLRRRFAAIDPHRVNRAFHALGKFLSRYEFPTTTSRR